MKYYAIKHKPTGRFMPETCKGYSYWDPAQPYAAYSPRLFVTKRGAANALTCWVNGQYSHLTQTESDGWEGPSYTVVAGTVAEPVAGRKRDDVEVVEVTLSV
jgi:hypothetical protein